MAYTRAWNEALPAGSEAANTLDDIIRNLKVDIRERLNDVISDFTTDPIVKRFSCHVFTNANQSLTTGVNAVVNFNQESFDNGTLHDNAVNNSRITIPANGNKGIWLFHGHVTFDANATGIRLLNLMKNGSVTYIAQSIVVSPVAGSAVTVDVMSLVTTPIVGDYFEIDAAQTSGGNLNILGTTGQWQTYFEAVQLVN